METIEVKVKRIRINYNDEESEDRPVGPDRMIIDVRVQDNALWMRERIGIGEQSFCWRIIPFATIDTFLLYEQEEA